MLPYVPPSPSPRRAWIEMPQGKAGRKEKRSPSPRRAWIEMSQKHALTMMFDVALPTEGVD